MNRQAPDSIAHRIWSGASWTVLGAGAGRLAYLGAMVLAARELGQGGFGALAFIQSTLGVLGLMAGLGLGVTLTRFVSAHRRSDPARASRILGLVWRLAAVTVALAASGLVLATPWMSMRIATDVDSTGLAQGLVWGAGLMALTTIRGLQDGLLHGFEAFRATAGLRLTEGIGALVAVPILSASFGVGGAVAGLASGTLVAAAAGGLIAGRHLRSHGMSALGMGWRSELPVLFSFSAPHLLASLAALPTLWLAMLWLATSANGLEAVGLYGAAYQWHGPLIFAPTALASAALPVFVRCAARRNGRFLSAFGGTAFAALLLSAVPAAFLVVFRDPILGVYGPGFEAASGALIWLALAAPAHAISKLASHALLALDRAWLVLVLNAVWAAVLMGGAWVWIPAQGATGLAAAFCLAYGVLAIAATACVLGVSAPERRRMAAFAAGSSA